MRDAMIFPFRWFDTLRQLPDAERVQMLDAIRDYAESGKSPEFPPIMAALWNEIAQRIDYDRDTYNAKCERNRENGKLGAEFGKLGGRPKNNKTPTADSKPRKTANGVLETPKTPDADADADAEADRHLSFDTDVSTDKSRDTANADVAGNGETPKKPKPKQMPKIYFAYDGDRRLHGVTSEQLKQWREFYDALDVEVELRQASAWLDANRRKIDIKRFLVNWLNKAQDRVRNNNVNAPAMRGGRVTAQPDYEAISARGAEIREQWGDDPRFGQVQVEG